MSVQVSTRIDPDTKKQFDDICELIGISPSNALSMFIKGVIHNRGIPFAPVAPAASGDEKPPVRPPFPFDCMKDEIWMADDFDAPLEDFKEYM